MTYKDKGSYESSPPCSSRLQASSRGAKTREVMEFTHLNGTVFWQVQKKLGECVEELSCKVLNQVAPDVPAGDEAIFDKLISYFREAKRLLTARTLL